MATKITSFSGLKKGQKFKVIANTNSHNYQIGKIYTMNKNGTSSTAMNNIAEGHTGNSINAIDIELVGSQNLKELQEELKELMAQVNEVNRKIKFCTVNKCEEYDADIEKVYAVLGTLNSKSSRMEKAKVIAKLIKES